MPFSHQAIDVASGSQLREYAKEAGIPGRSKLKVNELRETLRAMLPPREGTSPPLFVELCAGTAALSLRLHQEGANPPVSRMGSKRGYATAILHELGLYPGLRAEHYLWCEPDTGCRLLLEAYRDEKLAKAAAAIIRSWKDEEPRALWERLRAEGPAKCPPADAREVARWARIVSANELLSLDSQTWKNTGAGGSTFSGNPDHGFYRPVERLAGGFDNAPELPASIIEDAAEVDPGEVAQWAWVQGHGSMDGRLAAQYLHPEGNAAGQWKAPPRDWLPNRMTSLPTLPSTISDDATEVDPREVARWVVDCCWSIGNDARRGGFKSSTGQWVTPQTCAKFSGRVKVTPTLPATIADDARTVDPREVARHVHVQGYANSSLPIREVDGVTSAWWQTPTGAWVDRGFAGLDEGRFMVRTPWCGWATRLEAAGGVPASIAPDAAEVDPREVARWLCVKCWTLAGHGGRFGGVPIVSPNGGKHVPLTRERLAGRVEDPGSLPASISEDCTQVEPPTLPPGTVVYIDPPYVGTTGYTHALGRKQVIELALRWHEAGAMVAISEQEAIPELLALGWRGVDITSRRDGQKRTFSKQQSEFLTISPDSPC